MYEFDKRHLFQLSALIAIFLLLSVIGLWSFNTLSGLVDGPQAQYRHALAAFGLALALRFCFVGGWRRRGHERSRECEHAGNGK